MILRRASALRWAVVSLVWVRGSRSSRSHGMTKNSLYSKHDCARDSTACSTVLGEILNTQYCMALVPPAPRERAPRAPPTPLKRRGLPHRTRPDDDMQTRCTTDRFQMSTQCNCRYPRLVLVAYKLQLRHGSWDVAVLPPLTSPTRPRPQPAPAPRTGVLVAHGKNRPPSSALHASCCEPSATSCS